MSITPMSHIQTTSIWNT